MSVTSPVSSALFDFSAKSGIRKTYSLNQLHCDGTKEPSPGHDSHPLQTTHFALSAHVREVIGTVYADETTASIFNSCGSLCSADYSGAL
jgi:hypothetical protein